MTRAAFDKIAAGLNEALEVARSETPLTETERLRHAVAYCRMRLRRDAYRETLDAILRGDKDESIRNPDQTEVAVSQNEPTLTPTQLAKARHALGLPNPSGTSYRNRYLAPECDTDWPAMVAAGLAEVTGGTSMGVWYALTRKGAQAALRAGERLCKEHFPA